MLKLTYFPAPGRAFVTRVALRIGNIEFEDETLSWSDFQGAKASSPERFPLGQMPVMTLPSGKIVTQSGAQARYAGKLAGLYPSDPEDQLLCDEIIEVCTEMMNKCPQHKDADEKKKLREDYAANALPKYYNFLAAKSGGKYFVANKLSIADLTLYATVKSIRSGMWDFVPADSDAAYPAIGTLIDTMEADPIFAPHKL